NISPDVKDPRTQAPFTTFGAPYLLYLLALVTQVSLAACWYQKWLVHRRLRPEELAGRVEAGRKGLARYPLAPGLLQSTALERLVAKNGTGLLPQAYPEGCPTHPAYPAGHAVIAGACVTVLKAFFVEAAIVPEPVVPSPDGRSLLPWKGPSLTVGGELDKLASNIGMGRNFAGLHWRTDLQAGLALGEDVALQVLAELKLTGNELFSGWSLRRFDGEPVKI
ncbi:MAG TPA: vanadium-dependent haloperoxidase, partial [Thermoanaerobaculia bacterium]|nr:vanadium-dependent haloperoxidase [Thermoanaerobaculia bacterium]